MLKIGSCYIARFTKTEMPVRIESQNENGVWLTRSLTHGRVVFVRSESQFLRECSDNDFSELAKTVTPNRRSKRQKPAPTRQMPVETPVAAIQRKPVKRQPNVPEFGLSFVEAAYRVLRESKRPLTSQEIVDQALKKKLHRSEGATPDKTINAALGRIIKKDGEQSRFIKVGRGLFTAR